MAQGAFRSWCESFRARAQAAGISDACLAAAFDDVAELPDVLRRDRDQAEFTRAIADYLGRAVSEARVTTGRQILRDQAPLLSRIAARFGVPAEILVAIWGMESDFGRVRGDVPVIGALATLACDGRRAALFERELIAALRIVEAGAVARPEMLGSWAGAMGHLQFMPSTYLANAVDFDGDGRADIWSDNPTDALASAAACLVAKGWQAGLRWGAEISLPPGFDLALAGRDVRRPVGDWAAHGVVLPRRAFPQEAPAAILLPAGHRGPAFLVTDSFEALRRYNAADAYVLAVGHLSDRIAGGESLRAAWPADQRALTWDEILALQRALSAAGFHTSGADGLAGPNTFAAIRAYQTANGLPADGFPSEELLARLLG
ncbi:lytic murein transglycosylase [Tropicimonas sp. IMCC6043]|uniref:lytic murein transglycosylase n=1 Tax=Tropicimonas sp. IMCC6043 TaxID=2510645 RepID=UPI001F5C2613|nr:lytic murein transglycosylase [Tropicimonas sp. IMCC6043]